MIRLPQDFSQTNHWPKFDPEKSVKLTSSSWFVRKFLQDFSQAILRHMGHKFALKNLTNLSQKSLGTCYASQHLLLYATACASR